jgi:hypothetical protein
MSAELEFNEEISRLVEAVYLTPDVQIGKGIEAS